MAQISIGDAEWFDVQFDRARAKAKYGVDLPGFPDDDTQISFTGMCGRPNMQQAFSFYAHVREVSGVARLIEPRIMDFGAGWGRIARLWLRETPPQNIVAVDTMSLAIECLKKTGAAFRIIQNPPAPPVPDLRQTFDLIYAYSVFSHLSEKYTRDWLDYLLTLLRPGGHLVLTTRGERFIAELSRIKAQSDKEINSAKGPGVAEYLQQLRRTFPDPMAIRNRLAAGEFQFFPVGHGELIDECTGETVIPRSFFEKHYHSRLVDFREDVSNVDQSVVTLMRNSSD